MDKKPKRMVPEVRFKGFTDDWEQRKLGDFGSVQMNKRIFKNQTSETGNVPFYKIGTFGKKPDAYISNDIYEKYKRKYPYPKIGDLLISASGSIGKVVEYQGQKAYYQDSNIVWLDHNEKLLNRFLKAFYQIVKWDGTEGSTIKRLYNKNILKTKINLPTISEQSCIGQLIEKLDSLVSLQQRKLEQIKLLRKSLLQIISTHTLLINSKEINFVNVKISDIYEVTRGNVLAKAKLSSKQDHNHPYPVYSSQTKNNGLMGYYDKYLFQDAITWTTDGANAGTVEYRKGKFYSTNVNGVLLSNNGYTNLLTASLLNNVAFKYVSHVGNPKLMNNVMKSIKFKIPEDINTQIKLSKYLNLIDLLINSQLKRIEEFRLLKSFLLKKLFL